ncbi:hypothetical protein DMC30DRAFT_392412 [Rhodotorula diobovata]|uniref:CENP-V/GFA domain-containing protein n=1 Tax=Rhodotorula diobovata TaxID=5288 RepID=A0A5C5G1R5_9BASI|nr:hypothetical protein DMC30DRAFT_392412 [Rhodotorula diobovata]
MHCTRQACTRPCAPLPRRLGPPRPSSRVWHGTSSTLTRSSLPLTEQIKCHCTDCQLTSGTSNSSNILAKEADVSIEGSIGNYVSKAASGKDVTRIFCTSCGTPFAHNSATFGDSMAVQTAPLGGAFKSVPYGAELFVKDRWAGVKAVEGADQQETA